LKWRIVNPLAHSLLEEDEIAAESGLFPSQEHFARFPDSEMATVSINLLKEKNYKS